MQGGIQGAMQTAQSQNYANAAAEVSESQSLMNRLSSVRSILNDCRASAGTAADKIVGAEPPKLQPGEKSSGAAEPMPQSFIYGLSRMTGDLERVASEIQDQLSRLHRSF